METVVDGPFEVHGVGWRLEMGGAFSWVAPEGSVIAEPVTAESGGDEPALVARRDSSSRLAFAFHVIDEPTLPEGRGGWEYPAAPKSAALGRVSLAPREWALLVAASPRAGTAAVAARSEPTGTHAAVAHATGAVPLPSEFGGTDTSEGVNAPARALAVASAGAAPPELALDCSPSGVSIPPPMTETQLGVSVSMPRRTVTLCSSSFVPGAVSALSSLIRWYSNPKSSWTPSVMATLSIRFLATAASSSADSFARSLLCSSLSETSQSRWSWTRKGPTRQTLCMRATSAGSGAGAGAPRRSRRSAGSKSAGSAPAPSRAMGPRYR